MGPNGAGKSTLSASSWASPATRCSAARSPSTASTCWRWRRGERAVAGLYLAMQYPTEVPGVRLDAVLTEGAARPGAWTRPTWSPTLRRRGRAHRLRRALPRAAAQRRPVRRREEAQRDAAARRAAPRRSPSSTSSTPASTSTPCAPAPAGSRRLTNEHDLGVLAITHYNRLLHELKPDFVHILVKGRIVASGGPELADELERDGYARLRPGRGRAGAPPDRSRPLRRPVRLTSGRGRPCDPVPAWSSPTISRTAGGPGGR